MVIDNSYRYIYFLGIGGIGMSALARWFNVNGYEVAGYDRTPSPLTEALASEGIAIHYEDDVALIPQHFLAQKDQTLVVRTPAVPADHSEWRYFTQEGYAIMKRSQVLGWLTQPLRTVGVAGTHGKTTTSSILAHLLRNGDVNCAAFLGGITQNYQTNFLLNEPDQPEKIVCVVEADEFDRSFLTLFPEMAIITSTDADHLDIYGQHEQLLESFALYVSQIKPNGRLFLKKGLSVPVPSHVQCSEYALDSGDYHCRNLRVEEARQVFDLVWPGGVIETIRMRVPGFHNIENALAASAVALYLGLSEQKIREGLESYKGVKRRFEYVLDTERCVFIDDYAHHPTEITAFLSSVRNLYPDKPITAIFQPHLFTRTRDFADGFAESLSLADRVYLLDIYPARELPIEGVTSEMLLANITLPDKRLVSKEALLDYFDQTTEGVVVTIGAGDIDRLVAPLLERLTGS